MPVAEHEEASITTKIEDAELDGVFISKGRVQLVKGWKVVENIQSKDNVLPNVNIGDKVSINKAKIDTKGTKPPKRHNEKSLLRIMETCGKKYKGKDSDEEISAILSGFSIGTPATRAEIIQKLKYVGYIEAKGKSLSSTEKGRKLIKYFPTKELFDLEYTGKLEKTLSEIGKGNIQMDTFLGNINEFTKEAVEKIKKDDFHIICEMQTDNKDPKAESLGKCPTCGSDIIEGERGYGCTNWKGGCKFIIWKNDKFLASLKVKASKETVKLLLKEGRVFGKSFVSKKGNKFAAFLSYKKNEENDYYSWQMDFNA